MPFSFQPTGSAPVQNQAPLSSVSKGVVSAYKESTSLITVAGSILLGVGVIVTLGLFAYRSYLTTQIEEKKLLLVASENKIKNIPITDMRDLSNKLKIAGALVRNHPFATTAFKILEGSIEDSVTYDTFSLEFNDKTNIYSITVQAQAPDYKTVVQQVDTYKRKPYIDYMAFSSLAELSQDPTGRVSFSFTAPIKILGINPESVNFSDDANLIPIQVQGSNINTLPQTTSVVPIQPIAASSTTITSSTTTP